MNIYDIAMESNTSISTVSRVLNNKPNVNPVVKQRVEEVLKKYNYKPSAIARGMVSKTMKSIAILTVDVRVSHYARTVYMIEQEFSKKGYNVFVCNIKESKEECNKYIKIIAEKQVDGIVLIGSIFSELIDTPENLGLIHDIPVVIANGFLPYSNFYSIMVDDRGAIRSMVEYLQKKNYQKLFYVYDRETSSGEEKKNGFIEALKLSGVKDVEDRIFKCEYGLEGGKAVVEQILASDILPDAIIFGEDITAIGAMKEWKRRGYRIPEDLAITGCNNSIETEICEPELTTLDNKPELQGKLCADLLSEILEGKTYYGGVTVNANLVVKKST